MQGNSQPGGDPAPSIDYWQVIKNRYGVILLTFLLVFMTATVITLVMPKKFESTSVVQVHHSMMTISPTGGSNQSQIGTMATRQFMENEFETITAPQTLRQAATEMKLPSRWSKDLDDVVTELQGIVRASPKRGTDFIEIKVRHAVAEEAKQIADAVAKAYVNRRNSTERERAEKALDALDKELRDQRDVVDGNQQKLRELIRQYEIPYFQTNQGGDVGRLEMQMSRNAQEELRALKTERDRLQISIETLLDTDDENLVREAVGLNLTESRVGEYYQEHRAALGELGTLEARGYGRQHPLMVTVRQKAAGALENAYREVKTLKDVLQKKLELVKGQVRAMDKSVDRTKDEVVDLSLKQHEYNEARENFEQSQAMYREMKIRQQEARVNLKMPKTPITLHEKPKVARSAAFPNVTMNLLLGAGVGLIFGIGIAFLLEHLDTSVKSLEDVERYLQVPVLAVIPKDVGMLHKQNGMSPDAEAYRILRTNIEFNRKNPDDNSITVVSGGAGEGKSTTLVNLAYVCAQGGYTTLMIDADLRRPRLHTHFDINNSVGLTNYLTTDLALEDVVLQTSVDNLYFLPSGILPADAAGILNSRRMSELLQDVKRKFDLVLVDSPPILGVSDASVLASEVDLTMVVVQHRKLPRNMLLRVKQAVENVGGQVIGVVLNNVDIRSDSQYQYYTSYYTYYSPTAMEDAPPTTDAVAFSGPSSKPETKAKVTANDDLY